MKKRGRINLIIDIIMFLLVMMIAGIGFMIKYVLVPGYKRNTIFEADVDLLFWGLDRHQWGTIHLILGFLLLFLLFFHIVLHWPMVKSIYKRMIPGKKSRQVLAYMFLFFSILFGTGPLLIQPEVRRAEPNFINSGQLPVNSKKNSNAKKNSLSSKEIKHVETSTRNTISGTSRGAKTSPHEKYKYADINVDGSMTMKEITSRYNLSCSDFAKSIQVPVEHANVPFGRLRKKYGFRISEIKEYIQRHAK